VEEKKMKTLLNLIGLAYWKDKKNGHCGGDFVLGSCIDCEHYQFCKQWEEVKKEIKKG